MKKISLFWTMALLSASLLSGCGSKSASFSMVAAETTAASAEGISPAEQMAMPQANNAMARLDSEDASADTAAPGSGPKTSALSSSASNPEQVLPANRKLVRTVEMNVESTDFDHLISSISSQVSALGGYLEQSNISGNSISYHGDSQTRYATLVARIPSSKLDAFVSSVEGAGNVTNKSAGVSDVTLQYTDIESHKKMLNIEQERLWALLEKADSVESIIALEARLSEIRYQLESYESQLRLYDNQVDYSTVTLYIDEVKLFTPTAPETMGERIHRGFTKSIDSVKTGTANFIVWLLASSPVLLVWAMILVILFFAVQWITKKRRFKVNKTLTPSLKQNTSTEALAESTVDEENKQEKM